MTNSNNNLNKELFRADYVNNSNRNASSYKMEILNLHYDYFRQTLPKEHSVSAKFDTGASKSYITLGTLYSDALDIGILKHLKSSVFRTDYDTTYFHGITPNEVMVVHCYAKNTIIGNSYTLRKFHFWLSLDIASRKFLIGDDFISNCHFNHKVNEDIIVTDFSESEYIKKNKGNAVCIEDVFNTIKNIKASMLYKYRVTLKGNDGTFKEYDNISAYNPQDAILTVISWYFSYNVDIETAMEENANAKVELINGQRPSITFHRISKK